MERTSIYMDQTHYLTPHLAMALGDFVGWDIVKDFYMGVLDIVQCYPTSVSVG